MSGLSIHSLQIKISDSILINDLSLTCEPTEIWGILGANGIGKTTLLKTIAKLHPFTKGNIIIQGQPLNTLTQKQMAAKVGVLFQETATLFPYTVFETIKMANRSNKIDYVNTLLQQFELTHLKNRLINTLSGGEKRRLEMAECLAQNPAIYLLDEPALHLDLKYKMETLNIFEREAKQRQKIILMVLHEIDLARHYCDKVLMLFGEGNTLVGDAKKLLTEENLVKLFKLPSRSLQSRDSIISL